MTELLCIALTVERKHRRGGKDYENLGMAENFAKKPRTI
jgi:hypothetical protein